MAPKSVIDVGCAIGDFVQWFRNKHVDAWGLEGSTAATEFMVVSLDYVYFADLRKKIVTKHPRWELAMCIEVAEHIEAEYADQFIENLCSFSDKILCTVAGPGEKGHHHVNLQEQEYWVEKFEKHGYRRSIGTELCLKRAMYQHRNNRWISAVCRHMIYIERNGDGCN